MCYYKYRVLCTALALFIVYIAGASGQTQQPDGTTVETPNPTFPRLPLDIHYETLCPDSMYFIRRRLYSTLRNNDWWSRTELKLYPFGKANFYNNTETGELEVYCQHGNDECELNALHACILEHVELRKAFDLINCMLRSYGNAIDECANHLNIDVAATKQCKRTRKTPEILLPYGKETLKLELSFVPSIVFSNDFKPYEQSSIRYNFAAHFCQQYLDKFQIQLPSCK